MGVARGLSYWYSWWEVGPCAGLVVGAGGHYLWQNSLRSGIASRSPPCLRLRWAGEDAVQRLEQTLEINDLLSAGWPLYQLGQTRVALNPLR